MPYYVHLTRIDWQYERASKDLQSFIQRANVDLSSRQHTAQTFEAALRQVAADQPAIVADALVEDGFRAYRLYRARDGSVDACFVDERPEGALDRPIELPLEDVATVRLVRDRAATIALLSEQSSFDRDEDANDDEVDLPLRYDDESAMRALLDRVAAATDDDGQRFVAEVKLDRFLVELSARGARVRKLVAVTQPELFARLLRREYVEVPAPPIAPGEKREHGFYFPDDVLEAFKQEAYRLDMSLSALLQKAWKLARTEVARQSADSLAILMRRTRAAGQAPSDDRKQTLLMTDAMLGEVRAQAERMDRSPSFVLQAAWAIAHIAIRRPPAPRVIESDLD